MSHPAILVDGVSASASATSSPSTESTSRSPGAPCSVCSARTARARPPWCGSSPRSSRPDGGRAPVLGIDVPRDPRRCATHRAGRPVRRRRREPHRPGEPAAGRRLTHHARRPRPRRAPTSCSSSSGSPTPPTVRSGPTRAACAAGSTSPPRSCTDRRCCSSTSRPPGSTREPQRPVGGHRGARGRRHHRAAHHPVPRGGRPPRRPHRGHRRRPASSPRARPAELKAQLGDTIVEIGLRRRRRSASGPLGLLGGRSAQVDVRRRSHARVTVDRRGRGVARSTSSGPSTRELVPEHAHRARAEPRRRVPLAHRATAPRRPMAERPRRRGGARHDRQPPSRTPHPRPRRDRADPAGRRRATRVAIAWRNLFAMRRIPAAARRSRTIQPIIFVLMFRYVFGGAITGPPGRVATSTT